MTNKQKPKSRELTPHFYLPTCRRGNKTKDSTRRGLLDLSTFSTNHSHRVQVSCLLGPDTRLVYRRGFNIPYCTLVFIHVCYLTLSATS